MPVRHGIRRPTARNPRRLISVSCAFDPAVKAIIAGRADMNEGDFVPGEQVAATRLDPAGRDDRAGAVDDAFIGRIAADDILL